MNCYIKKHQAVMYQMLCEIDRICKKYDIRYFLFAGTALGAVRHKGFIPWDDDLDIIMLRKDYEYFLTVAPDELDADTYFLQKEFTEHWPIYFSKLRKNGTACIERYVPRDSKIHQGVYVDIFPCDNLSDYTFVRKMQFAASKVVIAKGLYKRGYLTDSILKKIFIAFCRLLPEMPCLRLVQMKGKETTDMVHCFLGAASKYQKSVFPRNWFKDIVQLPFEDRKFPVSAHYDALLTRLYGDYMKPTPIEERGCKVHAEIVDLEHSYEQYNGIQEKMKFSEYTRSIR